MAFLDETGLTRLWDQIVNKISNANPGPITTAGTGAAYTATVPNITALTAGVKFTMIPHTVSTVVQPTLNVNGLGAKNIRRPLSDSSTATVASVSASWLTANKPVEVVYNGTYWVVTSMPRPNGGDIYGSIHDSSLTYNPTISLLETGINLYTNNTETTVGGATALFLNTSGSATVTKGDGLPACELSGYKSLYSNSSGTTGTITLSSSAANFKFLEICFTDGSRYMTQRIYSPNGKAVAVHRAVYGSSKYYDDSAILTISGTSVTQSNIGQQIVYSDGTAQAGTDGASLKIVEVLGWN